MYTIHCIQCTVYNVLSTSIQCIVYTDVWTIHLYRVCVSDTYILFVIQIIGNAHYTHNSYIMFIENYVGEYWSTMKSIYYEKL